MAWFSQRKGYRQAKSVIQLEEMDDELRNTIWNALCQQLFQKDEFIYEDMYSPQPLIYAFGNAWWSKLLKQPIDTRPRGVKDIYNAIREYFFNAKWYEVYDFVEFTVACYGRNETLPKAINHALEIELAGYRLINGKIVELTSKEELESIEQAVGQSEFRAAAEHLQRAMELMSDRKNPDPRNSIKESISAVESAAKEITKLPKATLEDAIKMLEKNGELHACLKAGFSKLYAYTSDKGGIRHAMLDEPNLTKADALFFLVTCSAFINYLKSKI